MVVEALRELGGVARWAELRRRTSRSNIRKALRDGLIVVDSRGRYALPEADKATRAASRVGGVVALRSAALHWRWGQMFTPMLPEVIVPKHRELTPERRAGVSVHVADLHPGEIQGLVTSMERTLKDCLRSLPFDQALSIADSALREGDFTSSQLMELVSGARGPGSAQMRRVAELADSAAENAFESALRSHAIEASLTVRPQVSLYAPHFLGRPDLVDESRRIILEADSFEWHGSRWALRRDTRRYNAFVVAGWIVLRFSWEDVMFAPGYVRSVLTAVAQTRTERPCRWCGAA